VISAKRLQQLEQYAATHGLPVDQVIRANQAAIDRLDRDREQHEAAYPDDFCQCGTDWERYPVDCPTCGKAT
jgi:hypothetical protein